VHGPNPAHGFGLFGEAVCGRGVQRPGPRSKRPDSSRWPARPTRWRRQRRLAGGRGAARLVTQAPLLSGEGVEQKEKGWGSR
jgi:hypothetical protein